MSDESTRNRGLAALVKDEVKSRPFLYLMLLGFAVAGPFATAILYPDAPTGLGLFGGVAMGIVAALCAAPGRFL